MEAWPELLGTVELREAWGGQPAGAVGTVVELLRTEVLVEIADEQGRMVELLTVPYEALRISASEPDHRRSAG